MVTWRYVTAPWLGDRAADSSDYRPWSSPSGYIRTIPAGQTSQYLRMGIVDDDIPEHDERFIVALYDPVNVIIGTQHAWVTIIDDDLPVVSVADQAVSEDGGAIEFELELHAPGIVASRVDYATVVRSSAGDAAATPDQDYTHISGTAMFAPGVETVTVSVPIIGDSVDELDETFLLELSAPELLVLGDASAVGTIVDDDPGWVIDDRGVWEYAGSMVFTVIRDHTSSNTVTVDYTVTGASAVGGDRCTAGVDYIRPSGSVTLLPTQTQAEISVTVCDDDVAEGSEILLVELTGVPGRKLTGTGTIVDNDSGGCFDPENGSPPLQISFVAHESEREDLANLRFVPSFRGEFCAGVRLQIAYRTADGTATAPADYASVSGSVEFDPSAGQVRIGVPVVADTLVEADETLLFFAWWGDDMPASWGALPEVETYAVILDDD